MNKARLELATSKKLNLQFSGLTNLPTYPLNSAKEKQREDLNLLPFVDETNEQPICSSLRNDILHSIGLSSGLLTNLKDGASHYLRFSRTSNRLSSRLPHTRKVKQRQQNANKTPRLQSQNDVALYSGFSTIVQDKRTKNKSLQRRENHENQWP